MDILLETTKHTLMIVLLVFAMLVWVDYFNVLTQGRFSNGLKKHKNKQYVISSFLGSIPGCFGAFMSVSFYMHGLISLGAITAAMIATSGDEAFVMLTLFPKETILLIVILFIVGIGVGWITDQFKFLKNIKPSERCKLTQVHNEDISHGFDLKLVKNNILSMSSTRFYLFVLVGLMYLAYVSGILGNEPIVEKIASLIFLIPTLFIILTVPEHYLKEHIWEHIVLKHLVRITLWTFAAIAFVHIGETVFDLETFVKNHMIWVFFLACLLGIIPESGPHLIFVMLFANGLVPFSVLLGSSIVQDGHGMLPLLSYSVRDSIIIKLINLVAALIIAGTLFAFGI